MNPFILLNALRAYRLARHLKGESPRPWTTFGRWFFAVMITIALSFILFAIILLALHHFFGITLT